MDIQQRIEYLEKEIRETPYHKGTEHHIGLLRARIAKLRDELIERSARGRSGGGLGFAIKKAGDATVVLVGPPSVGKSTLLNALTNARSPVAPYAFTTVAVIPGMMDYQGAHIQLLDVPGLIEGAAKGRGKGREVFSVVRGADLLLLVAEVGKENEFKRMEDELYQAGVRINEQPPKVRIEKRVSGGVVIRALVKQTLSAEVIKDIAREFGIRNAEIALKESLVDERLIDAFAQNRVYVNVLYAINKSDTQRRYYVLKHSNVRPLLISALKRGGIEKLKQALWAKLRLVRIYLTKPGQLPDYNSPIIMRQTQTLFDVAKKIGGEFAQNIKSAKISGPGSKFPSQQVPLTTRVIDGMEVMFV